MFQIQYNPTGEYYNPLGNIECETAFTEPVQFKTREEASAFVHTHDGLVTTEEDYVKVIEDDGEEIILAGCTIEKV